MPKMKVPRKSVAETQKMPPKKIKGLHKLKKQKTDIAKRDKIS